MVVVKNKTTHQRENYLSRLTHEESPLGIEDDFPNAYLFNIEMVPKWSAKWIPLISIGKMEIPRAMPHLENISHMVGNLKLIVGLLDHEVQDGILRLCIEPFEQALYLTQAHLSSPRIHFSSKQKHKVS